MNDKKITYSTVALLSVICLLFFVSARLERKSFEEKESAYIASIAELSDAASSLQADLDETLEELSSTQIALDEARRTNLSITDSLTLVYAGDFLTTAYCCEKYPHICGEGKGITSSGARVTAGVTVAADTSVFPYGTVLYIEGVGIRVVQDTGSAIKKHKLDVAVPTHSEALVWEGYGTHRVFIVK